MGWHNRMDTCTCLCVLTYDYVLRRALPPISLLLCSRHRYPFSRIPISYIPPCCKRYEFSLATAPPLILDTLVSCYEMSSWGAKVRSRCNWAAISRAVIDRESRIATLYLWEWFPVDVGRSRCYLRYSHVAYLCSGKSRIVLARERYG